MLLVYGAEAVCVCRSVDGGKTWSDAKTVVPRCDWLTLGAIGAICGRRVGRRWVPAVESEELGGFAVTSPVAQHFLDDWN